MHLSSLAICGVAVMATAFPGRNLPRQGVPLINLPGGADEGNSGPFLNSGFDAAEQFVDVRQHQQISMLLPSKAMNADPVLG